MQCIYSAILHRTVHRICIYALYVVYVPCMHRCVCSTPAASRQALSAAPTAAPDPTRVVSVGGGSSLRQLALGARCRSPPHRCKFPDYICRPQMTSMGSILVLWCIFSWIIYQIRVISNASEYSKKTNLKNKRVVRIYYSVHIDASWEIAKY